MDIFPQNFLRNYVIKDYKIFDNFVFSLKVLQPVMATAGVCELCSLLAIFFESISTFLFRILIIKLYIKQYFTVRLSVIDRNTAKLKMPMNY